MLGLGRRSIQVPRWAVPPPPGLCGRREVLYQRVWAASCVAARFPDGGPAAPQAGESAVRGFVCAQQGSELDIWDGQPVCRCRDRCEKEPSFTPALPRMASPTATAATWMLRPACAALRLQRACPASMSSAGHPAAPRPPPRDPPPAPRPGMPQCHPPSTAAPHAGSVCGGTAQPPLRVSGRPPLL